MIIYVYPCCKGEISVDERMLPDFSGIWPEWKAVQKVGEGSFGKVFRCVRKEYDIETECAVKVVSIPKNDSEINAIRSECTTEESVRAHFKEIVEEFANEIKMMVLLKGAPNIVSVENYKIVERKDEIGWDIYIQMEFLTTFSEFAKNNTFTERAVAKLAADVCHALEICGEKNIIHRDIKPDNIFIDNYGNYKIGDFGVARKLESASVAMSKKGTYTYMAPEVYHGAAYDSRADIYSLGMVMYKLLNRGRDPFTDPYAEVVSYRDRETALVKRMNGENLPAPVDASLEMAKIIIKACSYEPKNRFASPSEFKSALNGYFEKMSGTGEIRIAANNGSREFSQSYSAKSVPLFADNLLHDKSKPDAENATVVIPNPVNSQQQYAPAGGQRGTLTGASVTNQSVTFDSRNTVKPPKKKGKGKAIAAIITVFVLAFAAVGGYFLYNEHKEKKQAEQIKSDVKAVDKIRDDFLALKISYDEADDRLKEYLTSTETKVKNRAKSAKADIDENRDDVENHFDAVEFVEDGDYPEALEALDEISYDYKNRDEIDSLISTVEDDYKKAVFSAVDSYIDSNKYAAARKKLEELQKYVDDREVSAAFEELADAELSYHGGEQLVYIDGGMAEFYVSENETRMRLVVQNNTGKTIQATYISSLEYDINKSPVSYYDSGNERYLRITKPIDSYSTYDMEAEYQYWDGVYSGTYYARACVRYVEYTDGTRWDNPYYELWLETYGDSYYG